MKILFCTDGSEYSFKSLNNTFPFLKKDTIIDLINIIDVKSILLNKLFSEEHMLSPLKEFSNDILNKSKDIIKNNGFNCKNNFSLKGIVADEILNHLEKNDYDLIILGSQSNKKSKRWLGKVCRKIINKIKIPALIIKNECTIENEKNILLATDDTKSSLNSLKNGINTINKDNSKYSIINVYPSPESLPIEISMDNKWLSECIVKQKELAKDTVDNVSNILSKEIKIHEKIIKEGDPAEEILSFSKNNKINLIIVGSHSKTGLSEFLLGSVSKRILDNSDASILLIPSL